MAAVLLVKGSPRQFRQVMGMDEKYHPVVFENGVRKPFPMPTRLLGPVQPARLVHRSYWQYISLSLSLLPSNAHASWLPPLMVSKACVVHAASPVLGCVGVRDYRLLSFMIALTWLVAGRIAAHICGHSFMSAQSYFTEAHPVVVRSESNKSWKMSAGAGRRPEAGSGSSITSLWCRARRMASSNRRFIRCRSTRA